MDQTTTHFALNTARGAMCQPSPRWLFRWVSPALTELAPEDCCSTFVWMLCKPKMDEKLSLLDDSNKLQRGVKETFTDDGWTSMKYVLTSECLDCYLFCHVNGNNGICFKRLGGPLVTLWLSDPIVPTSEVMTFSKSLAYVNVSLKLMNGDTLHEEVMGFNETVHDFISKCMRSRECRLKFTVFDWQGKKVLSPFGEEVPKDFKFYLVWHSYKVHEAGSIAHAHCNCQRSLKRQRED